MRVSFFPAFISLLVFISCRESASDLVVIEQPQMVNLIYDLMLADEFNTQRKSADSTYEVNAKRFEKYDQVYRLHKTDHETFTASYKYYLGRPDQLKQIYDSIEAVATRKRIEIVNPRYTRSDSLRKLKTDSSRLPKLID